MDTYSKGILTVIAICLVSITLQLSGTQTVKSAHAAACLSKENYNIFLQTFNNHGKQLVEIWGALKDISFEIEEGSDNITRAINNID